MYCVRDGGEQQGEEEGGEEAHQVGTQTSSAKTRRGSPCPWQTLLHCLHHQAHIVGTVLSQTGKKEGDEERVAWRGLVTRVLSDGQQGKVCWIWRGPTY